MEILIIIFKLQNSKHYSTISITKVTQWFMASVF